MTSIAAEAAKNANVEISLRGYIERTGNGKRKGNGLVIDPAVVTEIEGFNTRTAGMGEAYFSMPRVVEHLNSLANAYLEDPLAVMPISVQMLDGKPVLRQGACRIRAIAIANRQLEAEGQEQIKEIRVEEFRGSDAKAELFTLTGNSTLSLSVVAEALSIKRLVDHPSEPITFAELSKKRGKSEQHLRQLVRVLSLPVELQAMLVSDEVSMYVALEEYLYSGEEAVNNIRKAIDVYGKATASTLKHIKAVAISSGNTKQEPEPKDDAPAGDEQGTEDSSTNNADAHNASNDDQVDDTDDASDDNSGAGGDTNPESGDNQDSNTQPQNDNSEGQQTQPPKAPSLSSVLNKKTVTAIADTAIPLFERIAEAAEHKEGESVSLDTYTLVLTHDEMTDIINAHADMKNFLKKHMEKQNKGKA
ncbi:DNA-binding protein [Escherichia coli]|nr:DNA-binding protein [Escherichia coli]